MKISRNQLKKIIAESIELNDDTFKIEIYKDMIDSGDEENLRHIKFLAAQSEEERQYYEAALHLVNLDNVYKTVFDYAQKNNGVPIPFHELERIFDNRLIDEAESKGFIWEDAEASGYWKAGNTPTGLENYEWKSPNKKIPESEVDWDNYPGDDKIDWGT